MNENLFGLVVCFLTGFLAGWFFGLHDGIKLSKSKKEKGK